MSAQTAVDDSFFAQCLDWIPARYLLPASEEDKEEQWRRSTMKSEFTVKKQKLPEPAPKEKNGKKNLAQLKFKLGTSNADLVREAALKMQEAEREDRARALANETLGKPAALRAENLGELHERFAARIVELRQKNGVAGTRAERDKLLPSKAERKRAKREGQLAGGEQGEAAAADAISFGALELGEQPQPQQQQLDKKALSTKSIFNVKKLLKKAEAGQARIARLKEQGKADVVEQEQWDLLERKAEGEKVRDDPRRLKQTLKRLESKRKKAGDAWTERKSVNDEAKKDRIEKREANLSKRKTTGKKKQRPGFEGVSSAGGNSKKKSKPSGGL
jgi:hypothetical protein